MESQPLGRQGIPHIFCFFQTKFTTRSYSSPKKWILLQCPIYRQANWVSENSHNLPKVTQLVNGGRQKCRLSGFMCCQYPPAKVHQEDTWLCSSWVYCPLQQRETPQHPTVPQGVRFPYRQRAISPTCSTPGVLLVVFGWRTLTETGVHQHSAEALTALDPDVPLSNSARIWDSFCLPVCGASLPISGR